MNRNCTKCGLIKPLEDFSPHPKGKHGRYSNCKVCMRERGRLAYSQSNRFTRSLKKYGLNEDSFMEMYNKQSGLCAICKTEILPETKEVSKQSNVDHCHTTGKVRGLLCHHCNRALGMFKDNADTLEAAIKYLEEHAS